MKSETTWLCWHFSADTLCQCYISDDGLTALLCWYDSSEWPWAEVVTWSQSMLNGLREFTTGQREAGGLEDGWNGRRKTCCLKTEECVSVSEGLWMCLSSLCFLIITFTHWCQIFESWESMAYSFSYKRSDLPCRERWNCLPQSSWTDRGSLLYSILYIISLTWTPAVHDRWKPYNSISISVHPFDLWY